MTDELNGIYTEIDGAFGASLELIEEYIGKFIKVKDTNRNNFADIVLSEPTIKVEKDGGNSGSSDEFTNGKKIIDSTEAIDYVTADFTNSSTDAAGGSSDDNYINTYFIMNGYLKRAGESSTDVTTVQGANSQIDELVKTMNGKADIAGGANSLKSIMALVNI